jgi:phage-related protein
VVFNAVQGGISTVQSAIQTLQQVWSSVWNAITGAVSTAFGVIKGVIDGSISIFDIGSTIQGYFSDAITWLEQAGKDVIQGLINGLKDAEGAVLNTVKGIGGDIKSAFSSVLSIFSPSKVFNQLGQYIMQGLAEGVTQGSGQAVGAVTKVANQIAATPVGVPGITGFSASYNGVAIPGSLGASGSSANTTAPNTASTASSGHQFIINANTNANAKDIANEVGWALRVGH